jgi:(p)ppGpp synthase/HD superfamily hydrolase
MTPDAALILKALKLCVEAHDGQTDRDGLPHALHSIRVAEKQTTSLRVVIAMLHDVLEDTDVPPERILTEFGETVAVAVAVLTRGKDEPWNAYVQRVCRNEDAMWVKKADIEDNTRVERMDLKAAARMPMYKEAHALIVKSLAGLHP